jgi:hypothetical protein
MGDRRVQWIKLRTSLHKNVDFRRASRQSRLLFYVLLEVAGDLNRGGLLAGRSGPMTVTEIAHEAVLSVATTQTALDELTSIGFLLKGPDSAYEVARFQEKTQADPAAAERKRRQRDRDNGVGLGRDGHAAGHAAEREEDKEKESGVAGRSTRPPCDCSENPFLGVGRVSAEEIVDHPRFLPTFARTTHPSKISQARPKWLGWVRAWLDAGYSSADIWRACSVAHTDASHSLIVQSSPMWAALKRIRPEIDSTKAQKPAYVPPQPVDLSKIR